MKQMKNLLNCHSVGLHSFPISFENDLYRRIFYAEEFHSLWKENPLEIAIHPHHVDITITVLDGVLYNCLYKKSDAGQQFNSFIWDSVIMNGIGGFKYLGDENLSLIHKKPYSKGESFSMVACELHTVFIEQGKKCVWLVEEKIPSCDYFPVNYSNHDLSNWTPEGLYKEVPDEVRNAFIGEYISLLAPNSKSGNQK